MKPLFIAFTILLSLILSSCKDEIINQGEIINSEAFLDDSFSFYVQTEDGEDLLDSTNPHAYNLDSIKIYYRDFYRHYIYYNDEYHGCSRGFYITPLHDSHLFVVILSDNMFDNETESLIIEWNSTDQDTIDTKFIYKSGNSPCMFAVWDRIIYNGDTLATGYKSFYYEEPYEDYPTIIKEGNLLN